MLIRMSPSETYSRVWAGKHLSDMFPIRNCLKQRDAQSPLCFNFVLEYAIRRVQVNQDGLKLNVTHQLLVYADDVHVPSRRIHSVKKNTEALVAATKDVGLEINSGKTKYMVIFQDENAARSHNIKTDNSSFEKVEEFIYEGTTLLCQNCIQEEIKSKLKS